MKSSESKGWNVQRCSILQRGPFSLSSLGIILSVRNAGGASSTPKEERNTSMRRSLASLLVIGLLAALLASCGQSVPVQQTGATPTTSSHAHMSRIAWQGFLHHEQTTAAIFSDNADGSEVRQLTHPYN